MIEKKLSALEKLKVIAEKKINHQDSKITKPIPENQLNNNVIETSNIPIFKSSKQEFKTISIDKETKQMIKVEWQHFLGLFFGRHLFLILDGS